MKNRQKKCKKNMTVLAAQGYHEPNQSPNHNWKHFEWDLLYMINEINLVLLNLFLFSVRYVTKPLIVAVGCCSTWVWTNIILSSWITNLPVWIDMPH